MAHLGSLSPEVTAQDAEQAPERDTFDWYGETFTLAERLSPLLVMRMAYDSRIADGLRAQAKAARNRGDVDKADDLEGTADRDEAASMYAFLRSTLAPGEWEPFLDHTTLAGAPDDALSGLITTLIGVITDRPTRRPSGSPGGPSMTTPGSVARSSLSPAQAQAAELFYGRTGPALSGV